jgi:hypothetical protein
VTLASILASTPQTIVVTLPGHSGVDVGGEFLTLLLGNGAMGTADSQEQVSPADPPAAKLATNGPVTAEMVPFLLPPGYALQRSVPGTTPVDNKPLRPLLATLPPPAPDALYKGHALRSNVNTARLSAKSEKVISSGSADDVSTATDRTPVNSAVSSLPNPIEAAKPVPQPEQDDPSLGFSAIEASSMQPLAPDLASFSTAVAEQVPVGVALSKPTREPAETQPVCHSSGVRPNTAIRPTTVSVAANPPVTAASYGNGLVERDPAGHQPDVAAEVATPSVHSWSMGRPGTIPRTVVSEVPNARFTSAPIVDALAGTRLVAASAAASNPPAARAFTNVPVKDHAVVVPEVRRTPVPRGTLTSSPALDKAPVGNLSVAASATVPLMPISSAPFGSDSVKTAPIGNRPVARSTPGPIASVLTTRPANSSIGTRPAENRPVSVSPVAPGTLIPGTPLSGAPERVPVENQTVSASPAAPHTPLHRAPLTTPFENRLILVSPAVPRTPIPTAPFASAPAETAPVGNRPTSASPPIPRTPIPIAPFANAPTVNAPVRTRPISVTPVSSRPLPNVLLTMPVEYRPTSLRMPIPTVPLVSAPVENAPVQYRPTQVSPTAPRMPIPTTPLPTAPVENAPVENRPTRVSPAAPRMPIPTTPLVSTPVENAPVEDRSTQVSPAAPRMPIPTAPLVNAPVENAPVEDRPISVSPAPPRMPIPATPLASAPVENAPVEYRPTQVSPAASRTPIPTAPPNTSVEDRPNPVSPVPPRTPIPTAPFASAPVGTAEVEDRPTPVSKAAPRTPIPTAPLSTSVEDQPNPVSPVPPRTPIPTAQPSAQVPPVPVLNTASTHTAVENASVTLRSLSARSVGHVDDPAPLPAKSITTRTGTPALTGSLENLLSWLPPIPFAAPDSSSATQVEPPVSDPSTLGALDVSVPPPSKFAVAPQWAPEVAFGARIVEKPLEDPPAPDGQPTPETTPRPLNDAVQTGSGPHPENQRRETSRPDRLPAAPPPEPEPAAVKSAEVINPASSVQGNLQPAGMLSRDPVPEARTTPAAHLPAVDPRPTQPVRDVTLRLTSDTQQVDVKLIDRGGELHVAVQSADPILTSDLRASVHDLIGGLAKDGFHTDIWQPGDSPRHNTTGTPGLSHDTGDQPQPQTGEDPRRQGRNADNPDYAPPRRNRGSNTEWIKEISALTGAEREN